MGYVGSSGRATKTNGQNRRTVQQVEHVDVSKRDFDLLYWTVSSLLRV